MRKPVGLVMFVLMTVASAEAGMACTPTGFQGMTAALVNPTGTVTGTVNAAGCNIGVYYSTGEGRVQDADISGALNFGILVNGDAANVAVDVLNSHVHHIGDSPFNGNQRGVAVAYRAFHSAGTASGRVSGNVLELYQKGGLVANGQGVDVQVIENTVTGLGAVPFIAQNGIQVGYGASASIMKNVVSGHSYTGTSTVSTGVLVVGGPGYGTCPDASPCAYTIGTKVTQNQVHNNDVGIFLSNYAADFSAPGSATNIKVVNNTISNAGLTNNYGGFGYQAGIADVGNNDKLIANTISGTGYDAAANPGAYVVKIDADPSFTNKPKVHANK